MINNKITNRKYNHYSNASMGTMGTNGSASGSRGITSIAHTPNLQSPRTLVTPFEANKTHGGITMSSTMNSKRHIATVRSEAISTHDGFYSQRKSIQEMFNIYSTHYDLIQQSDPLEKITYMKSPVIVEMPNKVIDNQVNDGTLTQQQLCVDSPNELHVQRFRFQYYCIKIAEQQSPIQLYLKSDNLKLQNYKMYISTTATFPNTFNAEYVVQSKYFKYTNKKHHPQFTEKYLYLSIYAEDDVDLIIYITFGLKITKRPKSLRPTMDWEKYKQYFNPTPEGGYHYDKIIQNLDTSKFSKEMRQSKQLQLTEQLDYRIKQVVQRKKELTQSKQIGLISKARATLALKEVRRIQLERQHRDDYFARMQTVWLRILSVMQLAQNIKQFMEEAKRKNKMQAKGRLIAWVYKTQTILKIKESGQTIKDRSIFKAIGCLTIYATQIKCRSKIKAGKAIHHFLSVTHMYVVILEKHRIMINQVNYVKRVFRNLKHKQKAYKDRLWRIVSRNAQEILKTIGVTNQNQKKKHVMIDNNVLMKTTEEFIIMKKKRCQQYIQNYVQQKDRKIKVVDFALNLMQPAMFDPPTLEDCKQITQQYAINKKLIQREDL